MHASLVTSSWVMGEIFEIEDREVYFYCRCLPAKLTGRFLLPIPSRQIDGSIFSIADFFPPNWRAQHSSTKKIQWTRTDHAWPWTMADSLRRPQRTTTTTTTLILLLGKAQLVITTSAAVLCQQLTSTIQ
jgi:hypothetical protein